MFSMGYGYPTFRQLYGFEQNATYINTYGYSTLKLEWKGPQKRSSLGLNLFVGSSAGGPSGLGLGIRHCYYFKYTDNFHFYATTGLGFQREAYPYPDFYGEAMVGLRKRLGGRCWVYLEGGVGKTLAQAGVTFKFVEDRTVVQTKSVQKEEIISKKDTLPVKKKFYLSAGYGGPNFASVFFRYENKQLQMGTAAYSIKDKGAAFVKGEMYNPQLNVGIGFTTYYSQGYYVYTDGYRGKQEIYDLRNIGIGARLNLYMMDSGDFQSYLGAGAGAIIPLGTTQFPAFGEFVVGFRFSPSNKLRIYLEVGPSKVLAQAGLTYEL